MTKILIDRATVKRTLATLREAEYQIMALAPKGYIAPALGAIHVRIIELREVLEQPTPAQPLPPH